MRNRKTDELLTDALQGHLSCGLVHMTNISYQVGKYKPNDEIRQVIREILFAMMNTYGSR